MAGFAVAGYRLQRGSSRDLARLVKYLQRTYQDLYPTANIGHLALTVEQHFGAATPLWWVTSDRGEAVIAPRDDTVAGLWLGSAIHQATGDRQTYIFLLYVHPDHRRRGIGTALMGQAEAWAVARGDRHIALQVLVANQPAQQLYQGLGYQPDSILMVKSVEPKPR